MVDVAVVRAEDWRLWRELRLAALAEAPYAFGSTLAEWSGAVTPKRDGGAVSRTSH